MSVWNRIVQYRDFFDIPRIFLLDSPIGYLLFDCRFDPSIEDFSANYEVYALPKLTEQELRGSWVGLEKRAFAHLGTVAVDQVEFDQTNRRAINVKKDWFTKLAVSRFTSNTE